MEQPHRKKTDGNFQRNLLLLGALVCFVIWMISVGASGEGRSKAREAAAFEKVLHKKEQVLKDEFSLLERELKNESPMDVLERRSSQYRELSDRQGISIFYYKGEALKYWSDHTIPLRGRWRQRLQNPFLPLRNADYVTLNSSTGEGILIGLIQLRTHYPIQNEFLVNGFRKDFSLDPEVSIEFLEEEGREPVLNLEGEYLFSLDFSRVQPGSKGPGLLSQLAFIAFLVLLCTAFSTIINRASGGRRRIWIAAVSILIPAGSFLILRFAVQPLFGNLWLFQPDLFANRFFASLGHLLVISVSVMLLVALYYRYGSVSKAGRRIPCLVVSVLFFIAASLMFMLMENLLRSLVLDSGISLVAQRVNTLTAYSFVAFAVILMWFISMGAVIDRAITCGNAKLWKVLLYGAATVSVTFLVASLLPWKQGSWIGWAGMMLMTLAQLYVRHGQPQRIPFSRYFFLLLFISGFLVIRLEQYNKVKMDRQKEVELVKLSSEHDPVAEMLFSDISKAIRNDSVLARYMYPYIEIEPLISHLKRNYFSGYWTKYELQVTVCRPDDGLYLAPPEDDWFHCYSFFDEMILSEGIEVPVSDFYFLDNLNGSISYLAVIPYLHAKEEHRIFIELDSRIFSEELGYPELLLDEQYSAFTSSEYSYARYNRGVLISQDGDFPYRRSSEFYTQGEEVFEQVSQEGWDHSIYNVDDENTIIVGSKVLTPVDSLISFSYIFAINFLMLAFVYLLAGSGKRESGFEWSFKNRIQYSMIAILFLTFALICLGTIFFFVQQYRDKNNDNLRNTMRSVYIELIHKVEYEEDLRNWSSDSYYNLDELLKKFSNVFYSDINLYDENGELLATSRERIFDRELLSTRMNRMVFEDLSGGGASEIIHEEQIGRLNYISAYVPLLNSENHFLAYLNLPYFTQSGALTRDVTNMVVAVINIYLILLLVILGVSVFLADRITQPLRVIQSRIAHVSLSAKNETISYKRSDEIRGLVEEYNYMVQELERSAGLLAQSERESAWREMAKQVAHEIKNPLTPMKLNVQHLQRTMEKGEVDPPKVDRIAATLIEQIDSLSAIANEFSDFAKMPKAKSDRVNLVSKLYNLLQLFEASERAEIILDPGPLEEVYIFVDKEQLMRVFINLVKNGLQSIPRNRKGIIRITLAVDSQQSPEDPRALVTVSDNGKGIPEEIRDKLFRPNFTTKSAGMGMGLALSSSIVRSLGGKIWYETKDGEGTSFFVSLPMMLEDSE
jgi:signal transduction histidine kinase